MKSILFYISHPAHYQLFKNSIAKLKSSYRVHVVIKSKDILEDLLQMDGQEYINILPEGRGNSRGAMLFGLIKRDLRLYRICLKLRPNLLCGTGPEIGHVGRLLNIESYNFREDDVTIYSWPFKLLNYPWHTKIVSPDVCYNGKWGSKTISYPSYHELAYLHPDMFRPNREILEGYNLSEGEYILIRFAKLAAHHDRGIGGISDTLARILTDKIKDRYQVVISSERELPTELECYRLKINPLHIHDIMFYAKGYIGDSQTMAAEAGVLGTPFIRFNDFVGRLGYLTDLEDKYKLGRGILTRFQDKFLVAVDELVERDDQDNTMHIRRQKMLSEKINASLFISDLIKGVLEK